MHALVRAKPLHATRHSTRTPDVLQRTAPTNQCSKTTTVNFPPGGGPMPGAALPLLVRRLPRSSCA